MTPSTSHQLMAAGVAHQRVGRLQDAADAYRQVLAQDPDHFEALARLGAMARQAGRPDVAAGMLARAVTLRPDVVAARYELAAALRSTGRWDEALDHCRKAAVLLPNSADALCEVGTTLAAMGRVEEASAEFHRALALDPAHAMANYNLGVGLKARSRFAEAAGPLRQAVRSAPGMAPGPNNLGSVLRELGELDEALESYRRAIELQPNDARYHANRALVLQDLGRVKEAVDAFDASLALRPDYAKARAFRAMALLLAGDFARGLPDYESRREVEGKFPDYSAGRPQWDGSDVAGKTILLHNEQGLGDTIHFVRYAPLLAARGARVVVQCQPPLKSLVAASLLHRGVERVVAQGENVGAFDLYCPFPGLPHAFGTRLNSIPAEVPYLAAPPERVEVWRGRAGQARPAAAEGRGLRVGIVWAGAAGNRNDRRRSVPLAAFEPLARVPGVRLYSLQKSDTAAAEIAGAPEGMAVEDWGSSLADFADTAGALMNLDQVVTVDTSVAHLAGALARPVSVLLPFSPDWRWMLGRTDSPWYPTMRLFRQPAPGDWGSVFSAAEKALRDETG